MSPEACLASADDGLGAVGHLQLADDIGHVVAHGLRAEHQSVGDLAVARALGDEIEYLALAVAELWEGLRRGGGRRHRAEVDGPGGGGRPEEGRGAGPPA